MMRSYLLAATLLVPIVAMPSGASAAGSGTVNFAFTTFSGPFNNYFFPFPGAPININSDPAAFGYLNNSQIFATGWGGDLASAGAGGISGWQVGNNWAIPGSPASVELRYGNVVSGSAGANLISFTPAAFTNVEIGQNFKLGTLTFRNGFWFGGGETAIFNSPTELRFNLSTISADGAAFNQTVPGVIRMTVHSPDNNDLTTLGGQQAEADWLNISFGGGSNFFGTSFRVYDNCCKPAGSTNQGSVDIIARFNSLDLVGFDNPVGGFVTASVDPLPPVPIGPPPPPPGVPEPASWAMLIAGFGLVGATLRRRRALPV